MAGLAQLAVCETQLYDDEQLLRVSPAKRETAQERKLIRFLKLVGMAGLEPATLRTPCARSSHLNYIPISVIIIPVIFVGHLLHF